jgi:hypothetical protein
MSRRNAPAPPASEPGKRPRAANGQQCVSLGLLAETFLRLAARTEAHTAAASISRLPARRVVSPGARRQVYPAALPLGSWPHVRSTLATGLHRQLLGAEQPLQHGQQLPPVIDPADVVVSQAAGYDDWIATTIVATGRLEWTRRS